MANEILPIFLSCGTPYTPAQEAFLSAVEAHLRSRGCEPQTVGRSKFSGRQPVQAARDLIASCKGAVVIAFERIRIVEAVEKPGCDQSRAIRDEAIPTVWNQMEAAMAYAHQAPLLTLVQPGLKKEGMLSTRFERPPLERELTPGLLSTEEFRQLFDEWLDLVRKETTGVDRAEIDPATLRVGYLVSQLTPKQLFALFGTLIAVLSTIATIAFRLGQTLHVR